MGVTLTLGAPHGGARDRARERHPRARGQPLRPALLRPGAAAGDALGRRGGRRSTSAPSPRRSPRASASGGPSPRTPSERNSSWPTRPPCCRRAPSRRSSSRSTCRPPTGRARSTTFRGVYRERRDAMLGALHEHLPTLTLDRAQRRLLRLADPARLPRLQGDAAARGQGARRLHARARRSTPTAAAATPCGCRSAIRRPTSSARASAGWPPSSTASSSLLERVLADRPARRRSPSEREGVLPPNVGLTP